MPKITPTTLAMMRRNAGSNTPNSNWHGTALLIEAVIILAIVVFSMAVFVQIFGYAQLTSTHDARRTEAIMVATSEAEEFAADPAHYANAGQTPETTSRSEQAATSSVTQTTVSTQDADGFCTTCIITPTSTAHGTLYQAHITVCYGDETLYELSTSRYISSSDDGGQS